MRGNAWLFLENPPAVLDVAHPKQVADDVGTVGELDTGGGELAVGGVRDERHHVHGAALHDAVVDFVELGVHLVGLHPEVERACIHWVLRADNGALFHASDVVFVAAGVEGALAIDVLIQASVGTGCLQLVFESDDLVHFAGDHLDLVGLAQGNFVSDPFLHVLRKRCDGRFNGVRECGLCGHFLSMGFTVESAGNTQFPQLVDLGPEQ